MPHKDPQKKLEWWRRYYAKNRARIKAKLHDSYLEHRDERRKKSQEWYQRNRTAVIAKSAEHQKTHPTKQHEHYERHKDLTKAKIKAYQKANPERVRGWAKNRNARERGAVGNCTLEQWQARMSYYGNCCAYCRTEVSKGVHRDHVIPIVAGGPNWPSNLVPACRKCNQQKNTKRWLPRQPRPHGPLP